MQIILDGALSTVEQLRAAQCADELRALWTLGLVVTVDLVPLRPLAMGNYEPRLHVRKAIDHQLEAAKRGGYAIGPKCLNCGRRAGQEPCDWTECAALSPVGADHA